METPQRQVETGAPVVVFGFFEFWGFAWFRRLCALRDRFAFWSLVKVWGKKSCGTFCMINRRRVYKSWWTRCGARLNRIPPVHLQDDLCSRCLSLGNYQTPHPLLTLLGSLRLSAGAPTKAGDWKKKSSDRRPNQGDIDLNSHVLVSWCLGPVILYYPGVIWDPCPPTAIGDLRHPGS